MVNKKSNCKISFFFFRKNLVTATRPSALGMSDPIKDQLTVEPFK